MFTLEPGGQPVSLLLTICKNELRMSSGAVSTIADEKDQEREHDLDERPECWEFSEKGECKYGEDCIFVMTMFYHTVLTCLMVEPEDGEQCRAALRTV